MDSRSALRVDGRPLSTRTAESPRPIPQTVRLPNMSLSVANSEASTVQSRVDGLVTIGPTLILRVAASICGYTTKGSCHSSGESKVHA